MKAYEALKEAGAVSGVPMYAIGRALGKPDSYVSNGMSRGSSPQCQTMAAMLNVCGYSLVAVPSDQVPANAFVIDAPETDTEAERKALERKRERLRRELEATEQLLG